MENYIIQNEYFTAIFIIGKVKSMFLFNNQKKELEYFRNLQFSESFLNSAKKISKDEFYKECFNFDF
jgi:hypothetical protein